MDLSATPRTLGSDAALLVQHERRGNGLRRNKASHSQKHAAIPVIETGVGHPEGSLIGGGSGTFIPDVHAVELCLHRREGLASIWILKASHAHHRRTGRQPGRLILSSWTPLELALNVLVQAADLIYPMHCPAMLHS